MRAKFCDFSSHTNIRLEAETVEECAALARFGMNWKKKPPEVWVTAGRESFSAEIVLASRTVRHTDISRPE